MFFPAVRRTNTATKAKLTFLFWASDRGATVCGAQSKCRSLFLPKTYSNSLLQFAKKSGENSKKNRESMVVLRKVGKYEVGRTIGEGTFAKVKFAQNTETGESVAMKVLDRATIIKHKMVDQVWFRTLFGFAVFIFLESDSFDFLTLSFSFFFFLF